MAGDRDIIYLSHTCALFEALPHGQLAIVPGATHGVAQEKPALVAQLIRDFLG
jgi:pimeloyl-ACP methyl ester carboxylesterase